MSQSTRVKIELSLEDSQYASEQVSAGKYKDIGQATRVAFQLLRVREQRLVEVREEIAQLCADMDAGKGIDITSAEFDAMLDKAAAELLGG